jgi:ribose transport system substrate-binding protein
MWRQVGSALGVVVLTAVLAGCGSSAGDEAGGSDTGAASASDAKKPVQLAAFLFADDPYSMGNLAGVKAAAEAAGGVTIQTFAGKYDGALQNKQIQDAVATGKYNAMVVFVASGAAVIPGVTAAAAKGVKVVAGYAPIGPSIETGEPQIDGVVGTVWHPVRANGLEIANQTIEACKQKLPDGGTCKVAYISGGNAVAFEQAKLETFKETIAKSTSPKIELVGQGEGFFQQSAALKAAQNIVQAHRDLTVFTTSADQMTLGAEKALADAGLKGKVALVGNGTSVAGVQAVKEKRWLSSPVFIPATEGKLATQMVIDAVRGKMPDNPAVDVLESSPIGPVLDQNTTEEFTAEWG